MTTKKELSNATLYSIKEKLNSALIFALLGISFLFVSYYLIVLYWLKISLTPEAFAQIISAWATTLVVVVTLGLRLIDDVLKRYETFAKPRIIGLKSLLDVSGTKGEVSGYRPFNLPGRSRDLTKTSSDLIKYGRFFLTKLYPEETLNKIKKVSTDLDAFLGMLNEFKSYWDQPDFNVFLEEVFIGEKLEYLARRAAPSMVKEIVDRVKKEKSELIDHAKKLREEILNEIDEIIGELDSFLEAN